MKKATVVCSLTLICIASTLAHGQATNECKEEHEAKIMREIEGTSLRCRLEKEYNTEIIEGKRIGGTPHDREYTKDRWEEIERYREEYCKSKILNLRKQLAHISQACEDEKPTERQLLRRSGRVIGPEDTTLRLDLGGKYHVTRVVFKANDERDLAGKGTGVDAEVKVGVPGGWQTDNIDIKMGGRKHDVAVGQDTDIITIRTVDAQDVSGVYHLQVDWVEVYGYPAH